MTNIRKLSGDELSAFFSTASHKRATLEGQYFILDEHRKRLLDKLAIEYSADLAWNKAQAMARTSDIFNDHLEAQAGVKEDLYSARADVAIAEFEIRRRLQAGFTKNMEYKAGHLQT